MLQLKRRRREALLVGDVEIRVIDYSGKELSYSVNGEQRILQAQSEADLGEFQLFYKGSERGGAQIGIRAPRHIPIVRV